ncbi:uncharacterized protein LOC109203673 isoform X2 [Oreochromis niloticus]|uniref:uncharacterized protein LOC109203673 isoform X2 n=1 Tax=Oreochromis niloticus TaxID=8128 RepID=UPI000DF3108B|nr:uncharacterized protein LOC109203673 isoform X2 [Oreochromis niloticus]
MATVSANTEQDKHPCPHMQSMFRFKGVQKDSYIMRCLLCEPKQTDVSAYKNSTSNLRKHVARVHSNKLRMYTELMDSHRKRKSSSSTEPPMKNAKLTDSFTGSRRITQATFDKLLLTFVCEANQPFSIVETSSFKTMMETLQPQCTVMTRKTLCSKIQDAVKNMKSIIIKKLSTVNYVATTTDCWSARQHSYLGVTCHWIDDISLERHSAALACRPLKGSHTFDVLAAALEEIHSEYHIREKVTRTTTDSGSNFLKAFRLYGEDKEEETTNWQEDSGSILDDAEDSELEVEYQDVFAVLDDNTCLEYQLPRHQKCACHLLNLISTVDATAAEATNDTYKRLSRSAFAKCHYTFFRFNPAEMGFLVEYTAVMKPVAMALNILQGESSVHMGFLLPTLYQLLEKLRKLESSCKMCRPLVDALRDGIQKRFGEMMKDPELIAAAILIPRFRTSWTTEESILKAGLTFIRHQLDTELGEASTNSSLSDEDDFFGSMGSGNPEAEELERYLSLSNVHSLEVWMYCMAFLRSRSCRSKSIQLFLHLQPVRDFLVMQGSCSLPNGHSFTARTLRANCC